MPHYCAMSAASPELRVPPGLARRYTVQGLLGRGGMGAVFRAVDLELHRTVALKVVTAPLDDETRERQQREARALARVSSPHVVRVFDWGISDGEPYICMELVEGEPLHHLLAESPLDAAAVVRALDGALAGLIALHAEGLVHRDVKPANLIVRPDGQATLVDFGMVANAEGSMLTTPGIALGTPRFMAPELVGGARATAASDLFALAATGFEAATGQSIHVPGSTLTAIISALARGTYRDRARGLLAGSPLAPCLLAGLAVLPHDRPADAAAMRLQLAQAVPEARAGLTPLAGLPVPAATAVDPPPRPRKKAARPEVPRPTRDSTPRRSDVAALATAMVLIALASIALVATRPLRPPASPSASPRAAPVVAWLAEQESAWLLARSPADDLRIARAVLARLAALPAPERSPLSHGFSEALHIQAGAVGWRAIEEHRRWFEGYPAWLREHLPGGTRAAFVAERRGKLTAAQLASLRSLVRDGLAISTDHALALPWLPISYRHELSLGWNLLRIADAAYDTGLLTQTEVLAWVDRLRARAGDRPGIRFACCLFVFRRNRMELEGGGDLLDLVRELDRACVKDATLIADLEALSSMNVASCELCEFERSQGRAPRPAALGVLASMRTRIADHLAALRGGPQEVGGLDECLRKLEVKR